MTIFGAIYAAIFAYVSKIKANQCNRLMNRLDDSDPSWNSNFITNHTRTAFDKLNEALTSRDPSIMKDLMTERHYNEFSRYINKLIKLHGKPVIGNPKIKDIKIVNLDDYKDDIKDKIVVCVDYSATKYLIGETTGFLIEGERETELSCTELWTFFRNQSGWILDDIMRDATISDLVLSKNTVEHQISI